MIGALDCSRTGTRTRVATSIRLESGPFDEDLTTSTRLEIPTVMADCGSHLHLVSEQCGCGLDVTALFFGSSARRLFGVHHRANAGTNARHGVLLCYPGVQEYNGAHWLFRRLAGMLQRAGHDVLRFDYHGTGDSDGNGTNGRPTIWTENVAEAAAELRELAGVRTLSVVGMRLGAALALRASTMDLRVRTRVLWAPVVLGAEYLSELEALDRRRNLALLHADRIGGRGDELLGYPLPPAHRRELLDVDALALPRPQAEKIVIVAEDARGSYHRLRGRLESHAVPTELKLVKDDAGAETGGQRERARLAHAVLVEIVSQLGSEAH
jgi:pimeloyl-ACP methyl ester carboxylesterase